MSRGEPLDVVVVGAGVVGSAAALAAARDGLRVALVEAGVPRPWHAGARDLRVYAFAPDNEALLADLGVWPAIASARAHPYRAMRVWDAAGGDELHFDADAFGQRRLGHIVENDLLVDRLWAACGGELRLQQYCPDRVVALEQDDASATVILDGGRRLRARLVLAADGAASPVRDLAGIACDRHDYGQSGLVAYVRTEQPHEDTAWQRFLPTGPLAFLPCSDGYSSIVWSLPTDEADRMLALDDARFRRELTRAFDARLGEVIEVGERRCFPLRRQLARDCVAGRVALVGDAAHVVHPLAGQGVNLGLRDVSGLRLDWRRASRSGYDVGSVHRLARWARRRQSENALAAHAFEGINRLFSSDALLPTLLRGPLLGWAGRLPGLPRLLWGHAAGR